jgi:toxin-antitoxin system PIN domain toxin
VIAVDTNILVYAHRRDADLHEPAVEAVAGLAEGLAPWAIPWPCLHEFFAIATHPRIFDPPSTTDEAIAQLEAWLAAPSLVMLSERDGHMGTLAELLRAGRIAGPKVHDARIAALCTASGVTELWSADRDFSRFPALRTRNPLAT